MKTLFGDHCSASIFRHDSEMRGLVAIRDAEMAMMSSQQTQTTTASKSSLMSTDQFKELTLKAARLDKESGPSTPTEGATRIGRQSLSNWSQEVVPSSSAPLSQMSVISIDQTPRSVATNSDSSSSRQASQRRAAADMISPPPLKRVRLSEDSQMSGPM